jgi:hypothetical protein
VLLLEKDGVKIHWLTDGAYDRTEGDAVGSAIESGCRRGPAQLPLIDEQWNRVALALTGNTLHLMLNGQLVYQRPVEMTNQRFFGLFHFSDQSEIQVRKVIWRGNWPDNVPPIAEQELADVQVSEVIARSWGLPMVWEHDFVGQGLPAARFQWTPMLGVSQSSGVLVVQDGTEQWEQHILSGRVTFAGDFDIAATFDGLSTTLSQLSDEAALILQIGCPNENDLYHMGRRSFRSEFEIVETVHHPLREDGVRTPVVKTIPQASSSGTFRVIRHGDRILFLFAEGTSNQFRLVDEQQAVAKDMPPFDFRLLTQARGPNAKTRVVWKKIAIRATEIQSAPSAMPEE